MLILQDGYYFVFQGWVFNVVPWSVSLPSVLLGGWLADKLIAKGKRIPHPVLVKLNCSK